MNDIMEENLTSAPNGQEGDFDGEQRVNNDSTVDEFLDAPKSYKKEYNETFRTLPPEMRKYLHQRERETQQGFSNYQAQLKNLNDIYNSRKQSITAAGYKNSGEWLDSMAKVYDRFDNDIEGVLNDLAANLGYQLSKNQEQEPVNPLINKINRLEQAMSGMASFFENQRNEDGRRAVESFVKAVDENGNSVHPHFEDVKSLMGQLLNSGIAQSIEDAYDKAVWMVPEVQAKMIAAHNETSLKTKATEAAKAKAAGFDPKGKTNVNNQNLTIDEILQREFDAAGL